MAASVEPQTPEEEATLRELAAKHRRRRVKAELSMLRIKVERLSSDKDAG